MQCRHLLVIPSDLPIIGFYPWIYLNKQVNKFMGSTVNFAKASANNSETAPLNVLLKKTSLKNAEFE